MVSHSTGSRMAPTRGFYPTIAANQQSSEPAHDVERNGKRELCSGAGTVSSEETTDTPKPRLPLPRPLSQYAKEGGAPLQDQPFTEHYGHRAMHHRQCACAIWDCGNRMMEPVPYHAEPVWAQPDKRTSSVTSSRWMEAETSAR